MNPFKRGLNKALARITSSVVTGAFYGAKKKMKQVGQVQLTNDQKMDAINQWQTNPMVHPLTCRIDSSHELLVGEIENNRVILKCPTCGCIQRFVPVAVLRSYTEG